MAWQTPKTDWDSEDYFNFSDINRIENNSNEIAELIGTYQDQPSLESIKTNWDNSDIPNKDDINKIESNIQLLSNASAQPYTWITPIIDWESLDIFDYTDANRIESNLLSLYNMINNIISEFEYCGGLICGQTFNLGGV